MDVSKIFDKLETIEKLLSSNLEKQSRCYVVSERKWDRHCGTYKKKLEVFSDKEQSKKYFNKRVSEVDNMVVEDKIAYIPNWHGGGHTIKIYKATCHKMT